MKSCNANVIWKYQNWFIFSKLLWKFPSFCFAVVGISLYFLYKYVPFKYVCVTFAWDLFYRGKKNEKTRNIHLKHLTQNSCLFVRHELVNVFGYLSKSLMFWITCKKFCLIFKCIDVDAIPPHHYHHHFHLDFLSF